MTLLLATSTAFQHVTNVYNGAQSATETIPFGALNVLIEVWGATGISGGGDGQAFGGGAGSGGYARSSYFVAAFGGQTMNLTVGPPNGAVNGNSTVSSGTFSLTTMTGPGGGPGQFGSFPTNGAGGPGGAVGTGGNVTNLAGHAGVTGGAGGAGIVGINGTGPNGPAGTSTTGSGLPGLIIFAYT